MPALRFLPLVFILLFLSSFLRAQNLYQGSFVTNDGQLGIQLKPVEDGFQGLLVTNEGMFALKGNKTANGLEGVVYTQAGNYNFTGTPLQNGWNIFSQGAQYLFYQISTTHELDGLDLTPYFYSENSTANTTTAPSRGDNASSANNYSGIEKEIYTYTAGSQLVFYQRTSYVNDNTASSITYVNFCADGRFNLNYDGGFSVEGDYGGNAHGASRGSNYGTWKIETHQGSPVVTLYYANGQKNMNPVNINNLRTGRWRIGNTQYALARNKAVCR